MDVVWVFYVVRRLLLFARDGLGILFPPQTCSLSYALGIHGSCSIISLHVLIHSSCSFHQQQALYFPLPLLSKQTTPSPHP